MKDKLINIIKSCLDEDKDLIEVTRPKDESNGDYSTNIALKLAKSMHKNPMEIAKMLKEKLVDDDILKIEVKNPGFINFFVKKGLYTKLSNSQTTLSLFSVVKQ